MSNTIENIEETKYEYSNVKLWNPIGFIFIGVLFSYLPAAFLYSINYGRLGFKKERTYNLLGFSIFSVLIMVIAYYFGSINKSIFTGLNIGLSSFMYHKQKGLFKKHIESGGRKSSYLLPVIICLVFVVLIVWAIIYTGDIPDKSLKIFDDELYYTERISDTEVKEIGNFLESVELFGTDNITINAVIDKNEKGYIFSLIVIDEAIEDLELAEYMKEIGELMSQEVLNNQTVKVNLCNDKFEVIKIIQ